MLSFSLLGSCVTRDACDLGGAPIPKPVTYFSRSKLQSVVSSPTPVEKDDIGLASAFQTRVVLEDHRKTALPVLERLNHPLVIDLIDERFGLFHSGQGLVTDSLYLRNSTLNLDDRYSHVGEDSELAPTGPFARAVEDLAERLSGVPVVVHRATWATHAVDGEPLSKSKLADRTNAWLTRAYDVLESVLPDVAVVTPSADVVVGDPGHRWGLEAFHYVPDYYDDVSRQLRALL